MAKRTLPKIFKFERLGRLQTWVLPGKPFSGAVTRDTKARRRAYEHGFTARVQDFSQFSAHVTGPAFKDQLLARAFEQGYRDARKQENPDA